WSCSASSLVSVPFAPVTVLTVSASSTASPSKRLTPTYARQKSPDITVIVAIAASTGIRSARCTLLADAGGVTDALGADRVSGLYRSGTLGIVPVLRPLLKSLEASVGSSWQNKPGALRPGRQRRLAAPLSAQRPRRHSAAEGSQCSDGIFFSIHSFPILTAKFSASASVANRSLGTGRSMFRWALPVDWVTVATAAQLPSCICSVAMAMS